ncbi:hypothetical protein [Streptomyces sp. NPDC004284]|uniref:hypothetical protein n=1 Tax=Streptomyces sp. NPDC004284 TaxID=3364695 RepID=UPI0036753BB8
MTGCATCRVPKHAWTGRTFTTYLRTTAWVFTGWHDYNYHWSFDVLSGDKGPVPITAWKRQYAYRRQYVLKCRVVAWYGWGRQKILATYETRWQYSYRDAVTYRVQFTNYKWTRVGGFSLASNIASALRAFDIPEVANAVAFPLNALLVVVALAEIRAAKQRRETSEPGSTV